MNKIRMAIAKWLYKIVRWLVKNQAIVVGFADLIDNGKLDNSIKEEEES